MERMRTMRTVVARDLCIVLAKSLFAGFKYMASVTILFPYALHIRS